VSAADRAIRVSTAAAVDGVAGIAAYLSYWHAYEVVRAHGESGVTARLEPATIDGLVYASSMVVLYAARHRLPVPALARWLLALGIVATLAANVAHGWAAGPVGAVVAAWPAASLVGSYELLLWLVRTATEGAAERGPAAGQPAGPADCVAPGLRLASASDLDAAMLQAASGSQFVADDRADNGFRPAWTADQMTEPGWPGPDRTRQPLDQTSTGWFVPTRAGCAGEASIEAAAVAAYQASVDVGRPLSERKLAAKFGRTSRRWARHRMAEARQGSGDSRNTRRLSCPPQMAGQAVQPDPAVREAVSAS
jgi:Protein of unknown function (DUF2637)